MHRRRQQRALALDLLLVMVVGMLLRVVPHECGHSLPHTELGSTSAALNDHCALCEDAVRPIMDLPAPPARLTVLGKETHYHVPGRAEVYLHVQAKDTRGPPAPGRS